MLERRASCVPAKFALRARLAPPCGLQLSGALSLLVAQEPSLVVVLVLGRSLVLLPPSSFQIFRRLEAEGGREGERDQTNEFVACVR